MSTPKKKYRVFGINRDGHSVEFVKEFPNGEGEARTELRNFMSAKGIVEAPMERVPDIEALIDITGTQVREYFHNLKNYAGARR